jgi:hypothetical protein
VEKAVYEQSINLTAERVVLHPGLTHSSRDGNDNISQEIRVEIRELSFLLRKGKDIGGTINSAVTKVQGPHGSVTGEKDAQLRVRKAETL